MADERRRFLRASARLITWLTLPETGRVIRVLTLDVSAGGARFMTDRMLEAGTKLAVEIKLPDREVAIKCTGEVVRSRPMKDLEDERRMAADTAIKFIEIDPRDLAELAFYVKINLPPT